MATALSLEKERRWNKDRRFPMDEDESYDPDWEIVDTDPDLYSRFSLRD
jgi:hypothetical protein